MTTTTTTTTTSDSAAELPAGSRDDLQAVEEIARARAEIVEQLSKRIVGQQEVIDQLLIALFARGHCLFVGVPGLAKTLLISSLAELLNLSFSRIQFTPDLMPSDITGTDVLQEDHRRQALLPLHQGAALRQHRAGRRDQPHARPRPRPRCCRRCRSTASPPAARPTTSTCPFWSWPPRTPSSRRGPIPCPRRSSTASCSRWTWATPARRRRSRSSSQAPATTRRSLAKVLSPERIRQLQELVLRVPAADHVVRYAVQLCRASRPDGGGDAAAGQGVRQLGRGAARLPVPGPRRQGPGAALQGRYAVRTEDVQALCRPVLPAPPGAQLPRRGGGGQRAPDRGPPPGEREALAG